MTMREVDGTTEAPRQYWTLGGMQFIHQPDFSGPEGRLGHLGIMCEDVEAFARRRPPLRRAAHAARCELAAIARWSRHRIHSGETARCVGQAARHQSARGGMT